jgi:hypothetical protein
VTLSASEGATVRGFVIGIQDDMYFSGVLEDLFLFMLVHACLHVQSSVRNESAHIFYKLSLRLIHVK